MHGTGGQTRAFIHIRDTVRCISLAIANPPKPGDRVHIFNQTTETHRLIDLATMISEMSGTPYQLVDNPRNEAAENELRVTNSRLLDLGLEPTRLLDALLAEVQDIARNTSTLRPDKDSMYVDVAGAGHRRQSCATGRGGNGLRYRRC